jgi:hypothetical protein
VRLIIKEMQKLLIGLFCSMCFAIHASSQTINVLPLLEADKIWSVCTGTENNPVNNYQIGLGSDTTVNNISYKQVVELTATVLVGWIREDSMNRVYYLSAHAYPECENDDTTEMLLYDFGLHAGDTIKYNDKRWSTVDVLDSVTIRGVQRKRWHFTTSVGIWCNGGDSSVIEGIGSIKGLLHPKWLEFENTYQLSCLEKGGNTIYPNGPCACTLFLSVDQPATHTLQIYPNPTSQFITVNTDMNGFGLVITDVTGKVVFNQSDNCKSGKQIDISNLANGIYFLNLQHDDVLLSKPFGVAH